MTQKLQNIDQTRCGGATLSLSHLDDIKAHFNYVRRRRTVIPSVGVTSLSIGQLSTAVVVIAEIVVTHLLKLLKVNILTRSTSYWWRKLKSTNPYALLYHVILVISQLCL